MAEKMAAFILRNIQAIISIGSIVLGVIIWVVTMNDVPIKVENMENKMDAMDSRLRIAEQNLERNNTKVDLTLQAVYEIRGFLLKGNK